MATQKTIPTDENVIAFINKVDSEQKREDSFQLLNLIREATGLEPKMWGTSIIGFGSYHYKYASGHEGDAPLVGFSPRKQSISFYVMPEENERDRLLKEFGKYKIGKACIYINKLSDVDAEIVKKLAQGSVKYLKELYG